MQTKACLEPSDAIETSATERDSGAYYNAKIMYKANKTGTYVDYALQDTASQKFLRKEARKFREEVGQPVKLREAQAIYDRERADRQQ